MAVQRGICRGICLAILAAPFCTERAANAQVVSRDGLWEVAPSAPATMRNDEPWVRPTVSLGAFLDLERLDLALGNAPMERAPRAINAETVIDLPRPDGTFASFSIVETQVMAPALGARYPAIKTYSGFQVDDPSIQIRLDQTPAGFHAQILGPQTAIYIDPHTKGNREYYSVYHSGDCGRPAVGCTTEQNVLAAARDDAGPTARASGETLYTFRLAMAATGEYTSFHGGTVAAGLAAIVTAVNRVNGIYLREFSARFQLVANNDAIIYTNGGSDPYTNNSGGAMLSQNQSNLNSVIGYSNYDVGHVFSTGGGGVASLRATCTSSKARGVTGLGSPIGDAFYVDYVAHEIGHQFGGNHTFNGINGSCSGGNRNGSTAFEPGSGSTIMAYAGICTSADNLQSNSDPYFHSESQREVGNWLNGTGGNCAVQTATGNNAPVVDAGLEFSIPMGTPFTLIGSAIDPDEDAMTFCWEERDAGPGQTAQGMADNGSSTLFRSFNPVASPARTFPDWSDILDSTTTIGEVLPSTTRSLKFRLTARDNRSDGGGVGFADTILFVDSTRGPFQLLSPAPSEVTAGPQEVRWDVAGTTGGTIAAAEVNIWFSSDSGSTFQLLLAEDTPNDGSETVTMPSLETTTARILIEASDNVFFDVTDGDFTVEFSAAPRAADFPHEKTKDRYISFAPGNGAVSAAFEVALTSGPGSVGSLGYVGAPYDASCFRDDGSPKGSPCTEDYAARIVDSPVFRVWDESVIHLSDCGVAPDSTYELRSTTNGTDFSSPLALETTPAPAPQLWGDCVGTLLFGLEWTEPNGVVNFNDIDAAVKRFQDADNAPHMTRIDLAPQSPNYVVNFNDISMVIAGFQANAYPFSDPSDCTP